MVSKLARRLSPTLPPTSPARSIKASSEPNSFSHFAAVFGPHFGTPGMLSELSPIKAK